MYTLGILSEVGNAIMDGIRTFMLTLCDGIYRLIYFTFYIFEKLGTANILKDGQVEEMFGRIGLILGIFMIFRITFSFIQYIVDPDAMTDKNKGMGNIVKKVVIAIVLLGSTSAMFKLAYKVQDLIIENHIISRIIFNNDVEETDTFGGRLSAEVFTAFYRLSDSANTSGNDCEYYFINNDNKNIIKENIMQKNGSLDIAYSCITERDDNNNYIVDFDGGGFIALAIGVLVLYTIAIFTIQVGVRLVQLAYLQIIAPIPILMYITPKGDDYLKKWGQQCLTTFLDFFLRTAIIYFAVAVIQNLVEANTLGEILTGGIDGSGWQSAYVLVIMIIAVLVFAKKVPNLLKEIFPSLGGAAAFDYGLSFKKQVVEPLKTAYNTPLGWGLKLGKSVGAGIDRKVHGKNFFGRGPVGKAIDKWLPEQAEARKKREEAQGAIAERQELYEEGRKIYDAHSGEIKDGNGKLKENVFKNSEFRKTWQEVADAKAQQKRYDAELQSAQARLNRGEISIYSEEYKNAVGNAKAANGRLEQAKQDHENMRKIYNDDAKVEDAFNYYHDMQFSPSAQNRSREEIIDNINQLRRANGKNESTGFTAAERQAEAERRENSRSQYNNQHEAEMAAHSIFSDNDAMRQSDVEYNTGLSRPSASDNGAPTAENSIFNDDEAMRENDRQYNNSQNNTNNDV